MRGKLVGLACSCRVESSRVGFPRRGDCKSDVMVSSPLALPPSAGQVPVMASDILKIDLTSQSFMRDPFPALARLREAGPVVRVKLPFIGKTWLATTHEAVNEV